MYLFIKLNAKRNIKMKTLFFATVGSSKDSAITMDTRNNPNRVLMVFKSEEDLKAHTDKVWEDSEGMSNVIPFSANQINSIFGRCFVVSKSGTTCDPLDFLENVENRFGYYTKSEVAAMVAGAEYILRVKNGATTTEPFDIKKLREGVMAH